MKFIEFNSQLVSIAHIVSMKKMVEGSSEKGIYHSVQIYVSNHPFSDMREWYDTDKNVEKRYNELKELLS